MGWQNKNFEDYGKADFAKMSDLTFCMAQKKPGIWGKNKAI